MIPWLVSTNWYRYVYGSALTFDGFKRYELTKGWVNDITGETLSCIVETWIHALRLLASLLAWSQNVLIVFADNDTILEEEYAVQVPSEHAELLDIFISVACEDAKVIVAVKFLE